MKFVAFTFAALAITSIASANLIVDGGFEQIGTPNWVLDPHDATSLMGQTTDEAYEGTHSMRFTGSFNPGNLSDRIWQNVNVEVGQLYKIDFWVKNYGVGDDHLYVFFGDQMDIVYLTQPIAAPLESWSQISITATAIWENSMLGFGAKDNIGFYIDNVSLEAVPEPMTLTALALIPLLARKRKSR